MTAYILTPITETDNLPDGPVYTLYMSPNVNYVLQSGLTHYLRPVKDVVVLNRSQVEEIWEAGAAKGSIITTNAHGFDVEDNFPDKQTTIDNLFNKQK